MSANVLSAHTIFTTWDSDIIADRPLFASALVMLANSIADKESRPFVGLSIIMTEKNQNQGNVSMDSRTWIASGYLQTNSETTPLATTDSSNCITPNFGLRSMAQLHSW